jgi:catechol 2,3-dioxygenase-like lactoylglutathione lyase family enzyme
MDTLNYTLNLVKIPVRDFSKAARFYRETLGLKEDFAVSEYGWAQYSTGSIPLCIYEAGKGGGDGKPGGDTGVHLAVADVRNAYEVLRGRSEFGVSEIFESAEGAEFFTVEDPDGNSIKIGKNSL